MMSQGVSRSARRVRVEVGSLDNIPVRLSVGMDTCPPGWVCNDQVGTGVSHAKAVKYMLSLEMVMGAEV